MARRTSGGFTLIELLIVVAIIGIVAAIAIPSMLNAIDRGKQKRTMADIRALGTAVESYAVDVSLYPTSTDIVSLVDAVRMNYNDRLPTKDAWNFEMIYVPDAGTGYTIGSGGKNGGTLNVVGTGGPTTDFDDAIIFSDGRFVQWPDGQQR